MRALKGVERAAKRLVPTHWRKYFRTSKYELLMQRLAPVDLIVHVGAHWGEDAAFYEGCGADTVLWVEADPDTYARLHQSVGARATKTRHLTENGLVSTRAGDRLTFNRFNGDGASSSIYHATETYRTRFPQSSETGEKLSLPTHTLPEIMGKHAISLASARRPMLVVDVQGHELAVLRGLGDTLKNFQLCKCEVSRVAMYEGGALFDEVDSHMRVQGFHLASHRRFRVPRHGDVLYLRDDLA